MSTLRGPVLWPLGPRRTAFLPDGVVAPELPAPLAARRGDPAPERGLIIPGFADWHFHWVQMGIAGRTEGLDLLPWLEEIAWPAESRIRTSERGAMAAASLVSAHLTAVGTLCGAAYAGPDAASAAAFLTIAPQGFVCGPAVMTAGEPSEAVRPMGAWLADLDDLRERFARRLIVSPRFALSLPQEDLAALGAYAARHGLLVQTHLAENIDEVAIVRHRFREARDYTDVYARAGLLSPRTLLGHALHVTDEELAAIAASGSVVVHCPSSNRALHSGRMPLERIRAAGVRWVLGSDVGAGPSACMLDVMCAALDVHAGVAPIDASELFHRATIAPRAIIAGRTETEAGLSSRPGAIVIAPPEGVDPHETDPQVWLAAILDQWRRTRMIHVRRAVRWPVA